MTVHNPGDSPSLNEQAESPIRGGRAAAEAALATIQPAVYAETRNFLQGAVTRLSPYLRHGVLTLAEVRDHALQSAARPEEAGKLIQELAWRDYWQRLYARIGAGVWQNRENYKTGFSADAYSAQLPEEIPSGATRLHCMDSFSRQLHATGYLHNHARMWLAAYIVHWLRVEWQAGAKWFLEHLLDGDPASNNLSWQWVASTFGSKPYYFNRENLERYTAGVYCQNCALRNDCPLEGSYEELEVKLFPLGVDTASSANFPKQIAQPSQKTASAKVKRPILWIHTDSLNPTGILFEKYPDAPAIYIWDEAWLREEQISAKRVTFLEQCLSEMPSQMQTRKGDIATELIAAASSIHADAIFAQRTPDPRLHLAAANVCKTLPVVWFDPPPFTDDAQSDSQSYDLKRFSRYWQRAKSSALQPTGPA